MNYTINSELFSKHKTSADTPNQKSRCRVYLYVSCTIASTNFFAQPKLYHPAVAPRSDLARVSWSTAKTPTFSPRVPRRRHAEHRGKFLWIISEHLDDWISALKRVGETVFCWPFFFFFPAPTESAQAVMDFPNFHWLKMVVVGRKNNFLFFWAGVLGMPQG